MNVAVNAKGIEFDPFSFNPIEFDGFNRVEFDAVATTFGKHLTVSDAAIKAKDGDFFIADWLRNRNTVEFWGSGKMFIIRILIMANMPQSEIRLD